MMRVRLEMKQPVNSTREPTLNRDSRHNAPLGGLGVGSDHCTEYRRPASYWARAALLIAVTATGCMGESKDVVAGFIPVSLKGEPKISVSLDALNVGIIDPSMREYRQCAGDDALLVVLRD